MSWYASKKNVYEWATSKEGLAVHLPPRDYDKVHKAVRNKRLSRVALGMLKILFEHGANEPKHPFTRAVTKRELADRLQCKSDAIADAVNRINALVVEGAREGTMGKQWGLIWRNDCGVGIHPGVGDIDRARLMSDQQIEGSARVWTQNKKTAEEAAPEETAALVAQIERMTPEQRRQLIAMAARAETGTGKPERS